MERSLFAVARRVFSQLLRDSRAVALRSQSGRESFPGNRCGPIHRVQFCWLRLLAGKALEPAVDSFHYSRQPLPR